MFSFINFSTQHEHDETNQHCYDALIFVLTFATLFCEADVGTVRKTKAAKTTKASKTTKPKAPKKESASSCKKVKNYKAPKGSRLDGIIKSLVKSQDFSSYCRSDFEVAKEWFLNDTNHPNDMPSDDEEYKNYMTVRLSVSFLSIIEEYQY